MTSLGQFTLDVQHMVAANDRNRWRRDLRRIVARVFERVGLLWSAIALAAVLVAFVVPVPDVTVPDWSRP